MFDVECGILRKSGDGGIGRRMRLRGARFRTVGVRVSLPAPARGSSNGKTVASQATNVGSIPILRSNS